jgi:heat-inducible transcriptional repressor
VTDKETAELGPRKAAVLRAVVEEHIRTGEPVGSETVSESPELGVSSATIRNEMAALEELGYLSHPHTSAGRTPTHAGYRYYVDALPHRTKLRETQRRAITQFFQKTATDMEEVLFGATRLLSTLTQYAGLALPPPANEDRVVRAELLDLGSVAMLLVVGHHGQVYKAIVERPSDSSTDALAAVDRRLRSVSDVTVRSAAERVRALASEAPDAERALLGGVAEAMEALHGRAGSEHVVVGGIGTLAAEVASWRLDTMRRLFEALERESEALRMILEVSAAEDLSVTIGAEHPTTRMWDAAVVAAPYRMGETSLGTIGVVGPTRMDYITTMSAVRAVARRLSELASSLGG